MISHMGAVVSHDGSKKLVAVISGTNILDTIMGPGLIKIRMKRLSRLFGNKAGYTANTSCGRVGRGENARFHSFRLMLTDRPTDRPTDGPTDGQKLL